jgi:hypothetical protein
MSSGQARSSKWAGQAEPSGGNVWTENAARQCKAEEYSGSRLVIQCNLNMLIDR